ncbi:MarR family transcriptional regulator [Saccharopolyspora shandongensis]|uniref:MarR family transcriptional regulator n=1 Tax=Saccharopolyspora shandongensis TaxID=418495 RepID=UPI003CCC008C
MDRHSSINLAGLSDELGSIPSVTSRLCDRLQAAGLLVRRSSAIDRREIVLQLSPDGRRFVQRFRRARKADLAAVLQQMSARSRNALLMGLNAFYSAAMELGHADEELA